MDWSLDYIRRNINQPKCVTYEICTLYYIKSGGLGRGVGEREWKRDREGKEGEGKGRGGSEREREGQKIVEDWTEGRENLVHLIKD
jgi:hypothetical protein